MPPHTWWIGLFSQLWELHRNWLPWLVELTCEEKKIMNMDNLWIEMLLADFIKLIDLLILSILLFNNCDRNVYYILLYILCNLLTKLLRHMLFANLILQKNQIC